ncbi:PTS glucitol/sorbitol transporter subunit IIA, partial [Escherichia sp. SS-MK2]
MARQRSKTVGNPVTKARSHNDALSDQMLITFREGAPADLEEYCFIH